MHANIVHRLMPRAAVTMAHGRTLYPPTSSTRIFSPPLVVNIQARNASSNTSPPDTTTHTEEQNKNTGGSAIDDSLAERDARGRTGGGEPLASSENPPPQPKILNAKVAGDAKDLTQEQLKEVEEHNADFERKHGRAAPACEDKVDKKFWSSGEQGERTVRR